MLCLRIFAFQDVKSVVPYATCVFHSPELCLDLLARWGMSQINLVGAVMCDVYEPFAQNGTFRHQILQPYPKFF